MKTSFIVLTTAAALAMGLVPAYAQEATTSGTTAPAAIEDCAVSDTGADAESLVETDDNEDSSNATQEDCCVGTEASATDCPPGENAASPGTEETDGEDSGNGNPGNSESDSDDSSASNDADDLNSDRANSGSDTDTDTDGGSDSDSDSDTGSDSDSDSDSSGSTSTN